MASTAALLGAIASATLASTPPKRDSTEAACADVIEECKLGPEDEKCLEAIRAEWQSLTKGKDLTARLTEYVAIHAVSAKRVAAQVAGRVEPSVIRRALTRFCKLVERDLVNELAADPQPGVKAWLELVRRYLSYFLAKPALLAFHQAVEKGLLDRLRAAALKASKKRGLGGAARDAAIGRVRETVNDHLALYVEHVNAGVDDWHPPPEAFDTMLTVFSGGSAISGAVGSLLTALVTLEAAPVVFGLGIALTAVGGVFGAVVAVRGQLAAEAAAGQRQIEDRVRDALRSLGRARVDSLTPILDFLTTALAEAALEAKVDVSGATGTALSMFTWERLFPNVPQQRVAAAAFFEGVFDDMLHNVAPAP